MATKKQKTETEPKDIQWTQVKVVTEPEPRPLTGRSTVEFDDDDLLRLQDLVGFIEGLSDVMRDNADQIDAASLEGVLRPASAMAGEFLDIIEKRFEAKLKQEGGAQ